MYDQPIPDRPVAFGYKQVWLAVRDVEPSAVAAALGLCDVRPSNWKDGVEQACQSGYQPRLRFWKEWVEVFVSPPVQGWTLAVGGIGAHPSIESAEGLSWLRDLSAKLGLVQYFGTHRVSSYVAWAKAQNGQLVRAFAWADDTLLDTGERTPEEVELGFDFLDVNRATPAEIEAHEAKQEAEFARMKALQAELEALEAEANARGEELDESISNSPRFDARFALLSPDEDSVMMLAGRWSLDPTKLEEHEVEPGVGLLGSIRRARRCV